MIFCQSLETTTTAQDIYDVVKQYFTENDIPISNIMSVAADGAPAMMGKHKGVLKLLKNDNPRTGAPTTGMRSCHACPHI